ncbi:hypothetical protein D9M68_939170 [compost metagenome]
MVGEGDQALVPTAVVPIQIERWQVRTQALVQDTLQIRFDIIVFVCRFGAIEEGGWWHLLRVPNHDHLAPPCDGANGIPHRNLRRLVEDDHIEHSRCRRQVLCDGQRAHQHARREFCQG